MIATETESLTLPQFPDGGLTTHSAESCFRQCPRKYELAYVRGLRTINTKDPLRIGSAFHKGIEVLKAGGPESMAANVVRTAYAENGCPPWMSPDDYACEKEKAVSMVIAWGRRWADDQILKTVAVEISFDLPILNPNGGKPHRHLRSAGVIDWIAQTPDGKLAIIDHKTCSEHITAGAPFWLKLLMDHQLSRYWLAAHDMGYPVENAIFDATRKPGIKPKAVPKADRAMATSDRHYFGLPIDGTCPERESPYMYGARVLHTMLAEADYYFQRVAIARLGSDLEQFRHDQWSALKMIRMCEEDGYYPRNTGACTSHFGTCQYLDVCRGLRGDPKEQIPEGFRVCDRLHGELRDPAEGPDGE